MDEIRERERIETLTELVKNLMKNTQLTELQCMTAMGISEEDKEKIIKKL